MPGFLAKAASALKNIGAAKAVSNEVTNNGTIISRAQTITISLAFAGMFVGIAMLVPLLSHGSTQSLGIMQASDPLGNVKSSSSSGSSSSNSSASSVVNCAREQIGKPYVWGAESPNVGFDCSGLVTYCYRQTLGVEIGHYTGIQMTDKRFITVGSVDELKAGDIILDGGLAPSHVGIYSGNGTVIHAPTFGDHVREVPLSEFYGWVSGNETFRHYIG